MKISILVLLAGMGFFTNNANAGYACVTHGAATVGYCYSETASNMSLASCNQACGLAVTTPPSKPPTLLTTNSDKNDKKPNVLNGKTIVTAKPGTPTTVIKGR